MDPFSMFILPAIISAVGGGLSSAVGANQTARAEAENRAAAAAQRARAQEVIDRLRNANYASIDSSASRAYTRADNAAAAGAAQRGVQGGAAQASRDNVLASAIADLARFKSEDQRAREAQIGQILQDPAFGVSDAPVDVLGLTLGAGLGGLAGGAMQGAGQFLGSPEAMRLLAASQQPGTVNVQDFGQTNANDMGYQWLVNALQNQGGAASQNPYGGGTGIQGGWGYTGSYGTGAGSRAVRQRNASVVTE